MPHRRHLTASIAAAAVAGLLACGALSWIDTTSPVLRTVTIPVTGLEQPVRILHVSDLQGERFGAGQSRLAALLEGRRYDAIALTGDMVSEDGGDRTTAFELLPTLTSVSRVVVFVPGNHDDPGVSGEFALRGVADVAAGGSVRVPVGRAGGSLVLAALDEALAATPSETDFLVVLDHMPPSDRLAAELAERGADLYLAGHFHGGQMRLPPLGALVVPWSHDAGWQVLPETRGIHVRGVRIRDGLPVHISPGLGRQSVARLHLPRTFNRAEMTEIVLMPAE